MRIAQSLKHVFEAVLDKRVHVVSTQQARISTPQKALPHHLQLVRLFVFRALAQNVDQLPVHQQARILLLQPGEYRGEKVDEPLF